MKSFLTQREKELFSMNELEIINILGKNKMKIKDVCDSLYDGYAKPIHATVVTANAISRINKKCIYHGLNFRVCYDGSNGRGGKSVKLKIS